jgi:hypothetical protein
LNVDRAYVALLTLYDLQSEVQVHSKLQALSQAWQNSANAPGDAGIAGEVENSFEAFRNAAAERELPDSDHRALIELGMEWLIPMIVFSNAERIHHNTQIQPALKVTELNNLQSSTHKMYHTIDTILKGLAELEVIEAEPGFTGIIMQFPTAVQSDVPAMCNSMAKFHKVAERAWHELYPDDEHQIILKSLESSDEKMILEIGANLANIIEYIADKVILIFALTLKWRKDAKRAENDHMPEVAEKIIGSLDKRDNAAINALIQEIVEGAAPNKSKEATVATRALVAYIRNVIKGGGEFIRLEPPKSEESKEEDTESDISSNGISDLLSKIDKHELRNTLSEMKNGLEFLGGWEEEEEEEEGE